jgi:hypothetical protein
MRSAFRVIGVVAFALLISIPGFAQINEVSTLPVDQPIDVGGTILQPGTYTVHLVRSFANRNQMQVTSLDGKTIYATVLTVPHQLEPNEELPNSVFVFYPEVAGQPRALRTWFAPDPVSKGGHDIVYDEDRAKELARLSKTRVVTYTGPAVADAELRIVTPEATIETYTPPAVTTTTRVTTGTTTDVDVDVDTDTQTTTQVARVEMPQTAGNTPLLALLGLAFLGAAAAFRFIR